MLQEVFLRICCAYTPMLVSYSYRLDKMVKNPLLLLYIFFLRRKNYGKIITEALASVIKFCFIFDIYCIFLYWIRIPNHFILGPSVFKLYRFKVLP